MNYRTLGNKNLSIVVRTQKNLCNNIPEKKRRDKKINTLIYGFFDIVINFENINAARTVNTKSMKAMLKNRNL